MPFSIAIANKNHSVSRNSIKNILTANSKTEALRARSWGQWFTDGCKYVFTLNMTDTHFKQIDKLWDVIRESTRKYENTTNKLCYNIIKLRNCILDKDKNSFNNSLRIKLQPAPQNVIDKTDIIKLYFVDNNENPIHELSEFPLSAAESLGIRINNENSPNRNFFLMFKKIHTEKFEDIFKIDFYINLQDILNDIEKTWEEPKVNNNNSLKTIYPITPNKKLSPLEELDLRAKQLESNALSFQKKTEVLLKLKQQLKIEIKKLKIITNQNRRKKNTTYIDAHKLKAQLQKQLKKIENNDFINNLNSIDNFLIKTEELLIKAKCFIKEQI